jgi:DeoR/GlpR family transcriptional regulator of sugar metabolism
MATSWSAPVADYGTRRAVEVDGKQRVAAAAQVVHADLFLVGVAGVHPDAGLTTGDADEAAMKRTLAKRAADTYVLAGTEKIGAAARFAVLPLSAVAGVITDASSQDETVRRLSAEGVPVLPA